MRIKGSCPELKRLAGKFCKSMEKKNNKIKKGNVNYPVGDFLIRIKNAALANQKYVACPLNKLVESVAKTLVEEKYLERVFVENGFLKVQLSYKNKEPVLSDLKLISKPGLRVYWGVDMIKKVKRASIFILSTPKGIISSRKALKDNLGGEVIAEVL